ncbi:MAG: hypothetical protein QNJ65_05435 [Xenococcaceae cyanobacterium MO_234.B1]|nr:hypothetical protein [Xenococcaceae cyanobacterium MO_234.B1]
MTKRQIKDYLQDILDAIDAAENFIQGITFQDFQNVQKTALPNLRCKTVRN